MSKRQVAIALFNTHLPSKATLGDTKFRASVITSIMGQTLSTHGAAASLYNHAKKVAQETGVVAEFGRVKKSEAELEAEVIKAADEEDKVTPEEEFPLLDWAVVNKKTRAIEDTFKSRRTAQAAKEDNETVIKTSIALDALNSL